MFVCVCLIMGTYAACGCNPNRTTSEICDEYTGQCKCPVVTFYGSNCDKNRKLSLH